MNGQASASPRIEAPAPGACEIVALFRNRPIGHETAQIETDGPDGLCVRAVTEIATPRFPVTQMAVMRYDAGLRPRGCTVEGFVNGRPLALEVEIGAARATIRSRFDDRERTGAIEISRPPLLLLDNCFVSHVLAALAAARGAPDEAPYLSLPSGGEMPITRGGAGPVRLGGAESPPPSLTLHLAPGLDEHAWIAEGRVERLLIQQAHLRIECPNNTTPPGGHP